jgi:flavin-dependent dehydrogenase
MQGARKGEPMANHSMNSSLTLDDGSRIAVVGGGPAGSFFSYFLLMFAERLGREVSLDIFDPKDFSSRGPLGCNMCGGIISESLVQSLAMEGINLPDNVVQRGIDSYVMHTEVGTRRIDTPTHEKRIAGVHRGGGPRTAREVRWDSFDGYLLNKALAKGARSYRSRVTGLGWRDGKPEVRLGEAAPQAYDLLVGAVGVNSADLKLFEGLGFQYRRPRIVKTYIMELPLGAEAVKSFFGSSMHVFLLNLPRMDFAALIPKGDFVTLCMLGGRIDKDLIRRFLEHPEVKRCFPPRWNLSDDACRCAPKMAVGEARRPYADRVVLIGDCGASRLYKDGIGAAFRTARAAARTAVFSGISEGDFARGYLPEYRKISRDNLYGKLIFGVVHLTKHLDFTSRAVVGAVIRESTKPGDQWRMSSVLWDMFTGSSPYKDIFLRTLHPAFLGQYATALARAIFGYPVLRHDKPRHAQTIGIR